MAKREATGELVGTLLDEHLTLRLGDFCVACGVRRELVVEMVDEGVIEPQGGGPDDWSFPGSELTRALAALRLVRDLGVNWPGAALALELLDELDRLHARAAQR